MCAAVKAKLHLIKDTNEPVQQGNSDFDCKYLSDTIVHKVQTQDEFHQSVYSSEKI